MVAELKVMHITIILMLLWSPSRWGKRFNRDKYVDDERKHQQRDLWNPKNLLF